MHLANLHKNVTAAEQDQHLLVRIDSSITVSNAERIRNEIVQAWDEHPDSDAIILDLDGVPQMDSSGVGVLMEVAGRAEKAGVPLRVCCLQKGPRGLLQRTRLYRMFQVCETVQQASLDIPSRHTVRLPPAGTRARIDEERPRQSHRLLWTVALLLLVGLVAAGAYGFVAVEAYHGKMNVLPSMQASLVAAGQKIDAAGNSVRNWAADRDQWRQRVGTRIYNAFHGARPQTSDQKLQAQIDQRTSNLQTEVDNIQAAEKATDTRVGNIEEQVRQLQNNRAEQPATGKPAVDGIGDRDRKDFTLPVDSEQEVAPGVWVGFTNTDVAQQRYDGVLRLMPDRHAIGMHSRAIGEPLEFSLQGDNKRAELVVTRVTKGSVVGYVLLPRQSRAAAGAE